MVSAKTYYVAPTGGNNNYPGTITQPWATWQKAFNTAIAGDTVYFRGGVWYHQPGQKVEIIPGDGKGHSGTADNYIHYFNYPGETPILDGSLIRPAKPFFGAETWSDGLYIDGAHYIHWRGLTVRNYWQLYDDVKVQGIVASGSNFQIFENITVHNIGGRGFYYSPYPAPDTTYFINCDIYNCIDSMNTGGYPGGWGDGFFTVSQTGSYMIIDGCRAWNNSDDGFNIACEGYVIVRNCWSFENGRLGGDGCGFKLNPYQPPYTYTGLTRYLHNNIAAFNQGNTGNGFTENNVGFVSVEIKVYNNTSYGNKVAGFATGGHYGDTEQRTNDYRNNIACKNGFVYQVDEMAWAGGSWQVNIANTWTSGITFTTTDEDFLSLDVEELKRPRKADGSLPDVLFLKLDPTSDLVNAGVYVGLPYYDSAPDLGAFECDYEEGTYNRYPTVSITSPPSGNIYVQPTDILITTSANDRDGTISKVEFFSGNIKIGEATSAPWSFTWTNAPIGSHTIRAVVTDNQGAQGSSSFITLNVRSLNVVIYPNPNKGQFTLALTEPLEMNCTIAISSNEGKAIYNGTMAAGEMTKEFNLSNIPGESGTYVLVLSDGEIILTKVFVIR
jgi:hypothetical protein